MFVVTPLEKRFLMFLLGCIPSRLAIVIATILMPSIWLRRLAFIPLAISIGFWVIFFGGFRKTGAETMGAPIWWNMLRPIHAILWGLAAYYAWKMDRARVWRLLLIDVCIGLVSFTLHHIIHSVK